MLRNQQSMNLYADLAGKPRVEAQGIPPAPKKRAAPVSRPYSPLESDIQRTIIDGLRRHPMVGLVERQNSGKAVEQNADGSKRFVQFSRVYPVAGAGDMRAVDLSVTLKDGRRFAIEVKRGDWRGPTTQREAEQENYLRHIERCGGFGMFACSWDDVERKLEIIRRGHNVELTGPL
jgi:hypothetical protein